MRSSSKTEILFNKAGKFVGFVCVGDYCAEHEWGIQGLQRNLNSFHPELDGIERRRSINPDKKYLHYFDNAILIEYIYDENHKSDRIKRIGNLNETNGVVSAWSDCDLGIKTSYNYKSYIKDLYYAFLSNNVAIWVGKFSNNPFSPAGLCITIIDRIDEEDLTSMRNSDIDKRKLNDAAENTGIAAKLREADKDKDFYDSKFGYHSLSPSWNNQKRKSKYSVIFWLNPRNQDKNNYGWFTVEELEMWIKGKGPVLK